MAAKKKPKAKPKQTTVPKSAAQKGAEAALQASQKIALESQRARQASSSRGAVRSRQLRSGGTSLQQYDLQKFKSDPFPALGGGGSSGPAPAATGPATAARPAAPKSPKPSKTGKKQAKAQAEAKAKNRLRSNPSAPVNAELMEAKAKAKAEAKARAAAAKAKAKAKAEAKAKAKQNAASTKKGVGGNVIS